MAMSGFLEFGNVSSHRAFNWQISKSPKMTHSQNNFVFRLFRNKIDEESAIARQGSKYPWIRIAPFHIIHRVLMLLKRANESIVHFAC
jgi:hypothetical protein